MWLGPENWGGLIIQEEEEEGKEGEGEGMDVISIDDDKENDFKSSVENKKLSIHTNGEKQAQEAGMKKEQVKNAGKPDEYAFLDNLLNSPENKKKPISLHHQLYQNSRDEEFDEDDAYEYDNKIDNSEYNNNNDDDDDGDNDNDDDVVQNKRESHEKKMNQEDESDSRLKSCWNLVSYLPSAASIYFKHIVGKINHHRNYIRLLYKN